MLQLWCFSWTSEITSFFLSQKGSGFGPFYYHRRKNKMYADVILLKRWRFRPGQQESKKGSENYPEVRKVEDPWPREQLCSNSLASFLRDAGMSAQALPTARQRPICYQGNHLWRMDVFHMPPHQLKGILHRWDVLYQRGVTPPGLQARNSITPHFPASRRKEWQPKTVRPKC